MDRQGFDGEEVYTCRYEGCKRIYKSKFSLKRHYLSHMGVRNHKCPYCSKGFSLAQYLREHIHIHTGAKPFVCPYPGCGKQFRQAGKLSIHRKEHSMMVNSNPGSRSEPTANSAEAMSNLRAVEAVFEQLKNFAIPTYFYSKVLPLPEPIRTQRNLVQRLSAEYFRYKSKTMVSIPLARVQSTN